MPLEIPYLVKSGPMLWTVDDILGAAQCRDLISFINASQPRLATNNPLYRDQDRVLREDPVVAGALFERLRPHLPASLGGLRLFGLAHLLRLYRYRPGQRFAPHTDHWYQYDERRITLLTILLYLNDDFEGGETRFTEPLERLVQPRQGMAAIFQHKLEHEGCQVLRGTKYALRTDVIFEADEPFTLEVGVPGGRN